VLECVRTGPYREPVSGNGPFAERNMPRAREVDPVGALWGAGGWAVGDLRPALSCGRGDSNATTQTATMRNWLELRVPS
jgi:hypothetical protein